MALVADMQSPHLWRLWNTTYGYGSDAGDEGFVLRTEHGWALHRRGGQARLPSVFPTLEDALRSAGASRGPRR
jgi:hypothetical protein